MTDRLFCQVRRFWKNLARSGDSIRQRRGNVLECCVSPRLGYGAQAMKLFALLLILTAAPALADDLPADWEHGNPNGELAKQFPRHARRVIVPSSSEDCTKKSSIQQIGIERTQCYGKCPAYTFIVNRDGTFRYHGDVFVKRRGDWQGTVDPWRLYVIGRYVQDMNYFNLADEYTSRESDEAGAYTIVRTATRKKVVFDYGAAAPAKLIVLEEMIDSLMKDAKWRRR